MEYLANLSPLFFGPFLGFLSALGVRYLWRYSERTRTAKTLLKSLRREAESNLDRLKASSDGSFAYLGLFDFTVWNAAISSNQLSVISSERTLEKASRMYFRMAVFNEWDRTRVQAKVLSKSANPSVSDLDAIAEKAREMALNAIRDFLQHMENNDG